MTMTAEERAAGIARVICAEYGLNPESYDARGVEHPLVPVIARHVASALNAERRAAENDALERAAAILAEAEARLLGNRKRVIQVDQHTADVLHRQAAVIRALKHPEPKG